MTRSAATGVPGSRREQGFFVSRIASAIGRDRAVVVTAASRLLSVITGPLTIFFSVQYLSEEERGYYYTFFSLLGFSYLFDGAAAFTVQQKISHLFAATRINGQRQLEGDEESIRRIAELFRATFHWYRIVALVFIFCTTALGCLFFLATGNDPVSVWALPWIVSVCAAGLSLAMSFMPALISGIARVETVAIAQAGRTLVSAILLCGLLWADWRLYAAPVSGLVGVLVWLAILWISWAGLIRQMLVQPQPAHAVSWSREIWPMQWRMALSNTAGFFIYRALTPIVFSLCGPASAGRFGLTQMAIDYVTQIAYSWLTVRTPRLSMLWATKSYTDLVLLFRRTAVLTAATYVLGIAAGMAILIVLAYILPAVPAAFLGMGEFLLLAVWGLANVIVASFATFIRSRGVERFMRLSIGFAVATTAGGACAAFFAGELVMYCWLAASSFGIFVPWAAAIYHLELPAPLQDNPEPA